MGSSFPADVDHDVTIEPLVHEFGEIAPMFVDFETGRDERPKRLREYFDRGPDWLVAVLACDAPTVAVVLAPFVEVDIRTLECAISCLALDSYQLEWLIENGMMKNTRKPMQPRRENGPLAFFLLGLLGSPDGIKLYCQVALILAEAFADSKLRRYVE